MYDYIIIGAGIIGTCIARELSRFDVKVLVVDKEPDVANHQTIANSAIIHSGHDPHEQTLKAKLCVEGNALFDVLEQELDIPVLRTGGMIVAIGDAQERVLEGLYQRALTNQVKEASLISGDEARMREPKLSKQITKALLVPTTKVTYPWEVAFACMENAIHNGAELRLNHAVTGIVRQAHGFTVTFNGKTHVQTRQIISAAGVFSDQIAAMIEDQPLYRITPRKGEYFVLDRKVKGFINHVIYPVPNEKGKGVLLVPQVHGNLLVGPTSVFIDDHEDLSSTAAGLAQVRRDAMKLADDIPFDKTIRTFAGIRATSTHEDFFIAESKEVEGFYHVAGIDSPGLTAAPAIARHLIRLIRDKHTLVEKPGFDPRRKKPHAFHRLSDDEKAVLIAKDPRHGNLVCKCEKITETEIIAAIHGPLGADTIKGIKKRARAGSGLCQGGYCEGAVLKLIARERGLTLEKVNYYHPDTPILVKETKVTS
ncbi:MAG: FAD/NAD(P)-binding oxidoreductase [Acholeplasmataceae bacterium]|nr:MAG: FAD/NAD(P)-binding oxidoreductase [Acholeplasmataceae bacterium]